MGFVSVLASIIAYVLVYGTGHIILLPLSILAIVGCLWSWGIMHNYATNQARKRDRYRDSDEALQMVQYLRRNNPMANQPSPENRIQCNMVRNWREGE